MKLWKRAAAAIKDRKSLLAVGFTRRSNADLESAIIHATSHDDSSVDYTNAHRVYKWIRSSPLNLKTLIHSLSSRVNHTRSWIVSLKSLMLLHGVLCCKVPSVVGEIRKLPFDLSEFSDGHSCLSKTWGFNIFVRSYFAFLDQYSTFMSDQIRQRCNKRSLEKSVAVMQDLDRIQRLQSLLDMLLQIKPVADNMKKTLILEAMDCIVIESINIYGRICSGIIKVLPAAGKIDPIMVLKIVHKATSQGEDLAGFFDFCKGFGVSNARDTPQFVSIPKAEVIAIEKMIEETEEDEEKKMIEIKPKKEEERKDIVVLENPNLKTIITDKWETFEDDDYYINEKTSKDSQPLIVSNQPDSQPLIVMNQPVYIEYPMPDLITF